MSLRYATITNEQADGTGEDGTGGQRLAFKESSRALGNENLGAASLSRLNKLFPESNVNLDGYDPTADFKNEIIDKENAGMPVENDPGNPDFFAGVNLNYSGSPTFNLEARITTTDKPQHGVPNVRVEKDDLTDPLSPREPTNSPRRLGGFGTEYQINDLEKGAAKRETMGKYFTSGTPIHTNLRPSTTRLGKSDPSGSPYTPLNRSED